MLITAILAFFIFICILLDRQDHHQVPDAVGSGPRCIVVDLLNYIGKNVTKEKIIDSIRELNAVLKSAKFEDIFFVLKTRDTVKTDWDQFYIELDKLSDSLNVNIDVCYNYENVDIKYTNHTSKGRDDFYCTHLAYMNRCKVLSNDAMRDYLKSRSIPQFMVRVKRRQLEPSLDVMEPQLMKLRKPRIINFNKYI